MNGPGWRGNRRISGGSGSAYGPPSLLGARRAGRGSGLPTEALTSRERLCESSFVGVHAFIFLAFGLFLNTSQGCGWRGKAKCSGLEPRAELVTGGKEGT